MASESAFLNLPRELRDEVYRHYVTFEDGLVYNFDYDGKGSAGSHNILRNLAPANNRDPIDLALRSTCRQVHRETEGLILKLNTITFSSTRISRRNSDEVRVRAARFHFLRVPLTMEAASFLYYEDGPVVRPCYTQAVVDVSQAPPLSHSPSPTALASISRCYCSCSCTHHASGACRRSYVPILRLVHYYALSSRRIPTGLRSTPPTKSFKLDRTNIALMGKDRAQRVLGESYAHRCAQASCMH